LFAKRINTVLEDSNVATKKIADMGIGDKVKIAGSTGDPDDLFIAFSPANPNSAAYAEALGNGVDALRASGRLAEILKKYGLSDWK
jgi:polar amino acid transport system substrate-binding protein